MLALDRIMLNQFMSLQVVFRLPLLLALRCSLDHQNEIIHLLFILLLKKIGVLFFIRYLFLSIGSLFSLKVFISYLKVSNLTINEQPNKDILSFLIFFQVKNVVFRYTYFSFK